MMALDATGRDSGTLASTPAQGPVVDARSGQPVPPAAVTAVGASPEGGPAPSAAVVPTVAQQTAFDRFRSSISEYKPVYFDIGTRGQTTARFQISAKYRLFSPSGDRPVTATPCPSSTPPSTPAPSGCRTTSGSPPTRTGASA
ncbi:hypothetical protein G6F31_019255 [Rhizopus arrhizus]|nr:hypothetical protein G6F31_019255 [Rhizopus arrhizus]